MLVGGTFVLVSSVFWVDIDPAFVLGRKGSTDGASPRYTIEGFTCLVEVLGEWGGWRDGGDIHCYAVLDCLDQSSSEVEKWIKRERGGKSEFR